MKVKMLRSIAGPLGSFRAGKVVQIDRRTGRDWIARGAAVGVGRQEEPAADPATPERSPEPTSDDLDGLSLTALRARAKELGLDSKGRKPDLVARIREHG